MKKVKMISYLLMPGEKEFGRSIEQHFTINSKGRVWVTNYLYERYRRHYSTLNKQRFSLPPEIGSEIIDTIYNYLSTCSERRCGKEMRWDASVEGDDLESISICGSLNFDGGAVTARVRELTQHDEIIAFGGKEVTYDWKGILLS